MSVMMMGAGGCSCAPAATLVCDSISASITKCGFSEFGTASSPPKKYRVKTQTGSITDSLSPGTADEVTNTFNWSGALTYARATCTTTDTRAFSVRRILGSNYSGGCDATYNGSGSEKNLDDLAGGISRGCEFWGTDCTASSLNALQDCCGGGGPTVTSSTVETFATTSCASFVGGTVSGTNVTLTLSSEYTTADLIADVEAALPSYPGTWAGTCSSYRDLSSDELTYTIRRFKYKFTLPTLTGFGGYKINWTEGVTAKEYIWDGSATETPVYGPISEPGSNGTVAISNVTYSVLCS